MTLNWEHLRRYYKPEETHVLFVGESPPAGGTFFYAGNSNLSRYTQEAFEVAFDREFDSSEEFLRFFKKAGCYLDDLCEEPVNHLPTTEKEDACKRRIVDLAKCIKTIDPCIIIAVMRRITPYVEQARMQVGLRRLRVQSTPFPAMGHQRRYVSELVTILQELQDLSILSTSGTLQDE